MATGDTIKWVKGKNKGTNQTYDKNKDNRLDKRELDIFLNPVLINDSWSLS